MKLKIIQNPDKDLYDQITEAVNNNSGFCPCKVVKDDTTKCPCKEFRESVFPEFCH